MWMYWKPREHHLIEKPGLPCEVGPAFADIGLPCHKTAEPPEAPG